jgi:hypothetical protein
MKGEKEFRSVASLTNWEKNPRSITKAAFERLKIQLAKLGQYKPLLITADGVVLGGNMRLKAYKDMGVEQVWVSVVEPKNEKEMLEYALSDNDTVGQYKMNELLGLVEAVPEFDFDTYGVDVGGSIDMAELQDRFGPSGTEHMRMDEEQNRVTTELDDPFSDSYIRKIIVIFPDDLTFSTTLGRLGKVMAEQEFQNNTEAIIWLLNTYAEEE